MQIEIPGYTTLNLKYLVLDYNGTLASDGSIREATKERIKKLSEEFEIYILTADTRGTAKAACADLPVTLKTFPKGDTMHKKQEVLTSLGAESCVAFGNGRNDLLMCREAALSVAVLEKEGTYAKLLTQVNVCVTSIEDGLDLFLDPKRLIATLRG